MTSLTADDINPIIQKFRTKTSESAIHAVGGHSVVIQLSERIVAKVSLRANCKHLRQEQQVLARLELEKKRLACLVKPFLCRPDVIFMEPLMNGTLCQRIAEIGRPSSSFPWMVRITKAAALLESHGLAHGDMNPRNIIFDKDGQPVLADFDHSLTIGEPLDVGFEPYVRLCYTGSASCGQYGIAGAITEQFALGSIWWFILTGNELYHDIAAYEMVDSLHDKIYPSTTELGRAGEIIECCWHGKFDTIALLLQSIVEAAEVDGSCCQEDRDLSMSMDSIDAQDVESRQESELFYQSIQDKVV
jgi:serine/threonine protein kinase